MPLAPGTVIGTFEVRELLGAGGMGEVCAPATPGSGATWPSRSCPSSLALDPDRLARFRREAQVLASLNHPRIGAIHGVEDGAAGSALVLELVEGPTLAERIARGAVPLPEALGISRQIVEALEAAHAHGIVHRDLKPANIKLASRRRGEGAGLRPGQARRVGARWRPGPAGAPTITFDGHADRRRRRHARLRRPPSRCADRAVDERTDIWAFGCVLYEMLTGRRAFGRRHAVGRDRRRARTRPGLARTARLDSLEHPAAVESLSGEGAAAAATTFRSPPTPPWESRTRFIRRLRAPTNGRPDRRGGRRTGCAHTWPGAASRRRWRRWPSCRCSTVEQSPRRRAS